MTKARYRVIGAAAAVAFALLSIGPQMGAAKGPRDQAASDVYKELDRFGEVFERIRSSYVDGPDVHKMVEGAIEGMIKNALDPHSGFMDAKEFREMREQTRGEFGGLGIEVTREDGLVKVVSPVDDTPASKAGLRSGDLITKIDDEKVLGLTLNQAVDKLRGPVRTKVKLEIRRDGAEKPFEVTLVRDTIRVQSVKSRVEGDVGYIRITQFTENTYSGLEKAIADIAAQVPPARLKGYIIDLRNNPGGLLEQAVEVPSAFLESGEVVSTRGRAEEETHRFSVMPEKFKKVTQGKPVIVLINGGSASASEIVAAALQDHKRATLVGTRSFGKASVQTIIPLKDGALRLTTARYFRASGDWLQGKGVSPHIEVHQDVPEKFKDKESGGEASLKGHLKAEGEQEAKLESYVPAEKKDDKAYNLALGLLSGTVTNPAFPPKAK